MCVTGYGIQLLKFEVPEACPPSSNRPSPKCICILLERRGSQIDLRFLFYHVREGECDKEIQASCRETRCCSSHRFMCKEKSWAKAMATVLGCGQPLHPSSSFPFQQVGLPASCSFTSGAELCQPLFLQT